MKRQVLGFLIMIISYASFSQCTAIAGRYIDKLYVCEVVKDDGVNSCGSFKELYDLSLLT